mgnify:CR=1 FL=1
MAEFVEATERLAGIRPAVSMFGSARAAADSPYYSLAERTARLFADAGFAVLSGGGPGVLKRFGRRRPDVIVSIEEWVRVEEDKKALKRGMKRRRAGDDAQG